MAHRHQSFNLFVGSGIPENNPVELDMSFTPGIVQSIRVVVPGGLGAGIGIAYAHEVIIPHAGEGFILSTDTSQSLPFDLDDFPTGGAWSAFCFNSAGASSTFSVHFAILELPLPAERQRSGALNPRDIYAAVR